MTTRSAGDDDGAWVSAPAAARLLGVKRETLYAYVSRGLVRSTLHDGGRRRAYHRDDLERLRTRSQARAGHAAVAAAALRWGEPVLETRVGTIRDEGPVYRGRSAIELAQGGASFEEVCELLWAQERSAFPPGPLPEASRLAAGIGAGPNDRNSPFDAMLVTSAALATAGDGPTESAPVLVRLLAAASAGSAGRAAVKASLRAPDTARALLVALGGDGSSDACADAMREALVLTADHELNASTFAARVAASAGARLSACITAALATLSGPLHGATTARVEALVAEVGRPARARAVVAKSRARGQAVPGFGHPLYRRGDPRGRRLLELAQRIDADAPSVRVLVALTSAMELAGGEPPTLDAGLVALASALHLRPGAPLAMFACGRLAGWMAHVFEQREAAFLLRPRARYVGD